MSSLFSVLYKENVFTQLQSVAHCPDDNIVVPEKDPKKKKKVRTGQWQCQNRFPNKSIQILATVRAVCPENTTWDFA